MRPVPTHPRVIASFAYDDVGRRLSACPIDGEATLCSGVPETMFHVFRKSLTPEEFFFDYIASHFPREIASARLKPRALR